jgi:starch-binding outer membrane protein, SusD/RagB family
MMNTFRTGFHGAAVLCFALAVSAGCDDFLDVKNPDLLEADQIDPDRDRTILSRSAFQAFTSQYGDITVYVAWFTHEARVGDTFPTRNEFGRRDIVDNNPHTEDWWEDLHESLQFADTTARQIESSGAEPNLDLARAYFTAGYSMIMIGDLFCEATVAANWKTARGPITSAQVLDSAIARLTLAHDVASVLTGTEAANLATASLVGIARAHLQVGRKAEASTMAAQVPADFQFNLLHMDDPTNRALGNDIWAFSENRISLVVPPDFIAMADAGDPRISWVDMGRPAQDGVLRFIRQNKYKGWGDEQRLASGLEAQYIRVEADGNPADMLAFINERRAVGLQTPLEATTDMDVLLNALMEQKTRDFWLEGKRVGDLRRNPSHVPYIIPPGNTYYKTAVGQVSDQTCWPVPRSEKENNPFWPK